MEILSCRVLLPASIAYKDDEGNEKSVFVYINHADRRVILVDGDIPEDATELMKKSYDFIIAARQKRAVQTPSTPTEGFTKLRPETYMD